MEGNGIPGYIKKEMSHVYGSFFEHITAITYQEETNMVTEKSFWKSAFNGEEVNIFHHIENKSGAYIEVLTVWCDPGEDLCAGQGTAD